MHGLIFETSIWLLAESTRLLSLTKTRICWITCPPQNQYKTWYDGRLLLAFRVNEFVASDRSNGSTSILHSSLSNLSRGRASYLASTIQPSNSSVSPLIIDSRHPIMQNLQKPLWRSADSNSKNCTTKIKTYERQWWNQSAVAVGPLPFVYRPPLCPICLWTITSHCVAINQHSHYGFSIVTLARKLMARQQRTALNNISDIEWVPPAGVAWTLVLCPVPTTPPTEKGVLTLIVSIWIASARQD